MQGTLVVCFQRGADALAASGRHHTVGGVVHLLWGAYSMRVVSCEQRVVRTCMVEGGLTLEAAAVMDWEGQQQRKPTSVEVWRRQQQFEPVAVV